MQEELNTTQEENRPLNLLANQMNYVDIQSMYTALSYLTLATEVIKLIICLCVIATDIFLLTVICRFSNLQTKTNSYIKHYIVFNIIYMVVTPGFWIFIEITSLNGFVSAEVHCLVMLVENSGILFCHLFSFGLASDWLISKRRRTAKKYDHYSIEIIYVLGVLVFVIQCGLCFTNYYRFRYILGQTVYVLIMIFILVCNYLDYVKTIPVDNKGTYALIIANVMIFSWVPLYLYRELLAVTQNVVVPRMVLLFTRFIPEWLAYGCPIVVLVLLGRINTDFRMAYNNAFKRTEKSPEVSFDSLYECDFEAPINTKSVYL